MGIFTSSIVFRRFEKVLVFATVLGLLLQVLSARLGIVTGSLVLYSTPTSVSGKHLALVCREEYGTKTPLTICLWLITEVQLLYYIVC